MPTLRINPRRQIARLATKLAQLSSAVHPPTGLQRSSRHTPNTPDNTMRRASPSQTNARHIRRRTSSHTPNVLHLLRLHLQRTHASIGIGEQTRTQQWVMDLLGRRRGDQFRRNTRRARRTLRLFLKHLQLLHPRSLQLPQHLLHLREFQHQHLPQVSHQGRVRSLSTQTMLRVLSVVRRMRSNSTVGRSLSPNNKHRIVHL